MSRRPPAADALGRCLDRVEGPGAVVEGLRRLSGGASRESWAFDATTAAGVRLELVLRRDPTARQATGPSDRSTESRLLIAAGEHGVPVPAVVVLLEPDDELGSGFVMERIAGETIPRRILRDDEYAAARAAMAGQCGAIAARIHSVPVAGLPRLAVLDAEASLAQQRDLLDLFGEPHPTFELGLRWLSERVPPAPPEPRLVHGDFRNGNFIVGPEGIRSVLDWELAHLGDPIEDLGWLCVKSWRFGVVDRPVGGFGTIAELAAAYEAAGGAPVTEEALRFWVALGTIRWGVICIGQSFTHLSGIVRSVELATLGRRVAEMEWDLLELLDGRW